MEIRSESADQTQKIASRLSHDLGDYNLVCLFGGLGSGKTTFAAGFAKGLGIKKRILSPTFVFVREYQVPKSPKVFYHVDLYRLDKVEDIKGLDLFDLWNNKNNLVMVEWAEKLSGILPKGRIEVRLKVIDESKRSIQIARI